MGVRGPVPKRTDQRHGHRKAEPTDKAPAGNDRTKPPGGTPSPRGTFTVPLADGAWHSTAKKWYQSLRYSGQSAWYEASDWMEAYVAAEVLSEMLFAEKLSAMLFASWSSHTARLLVTEGDRRRVRIELERAGKTDPVADAAKTDIAGWHKRLSVVPGGA